MTLTVVRPISAAGVWTAGRPAVRFVNSAGVVAPGTGIMIVRTPSGPVGPGAATDFTFGFPGLTLAGEPPIPYTAAAPGTISQAKSTGSCETAAGAPAIYTLWVDILDGNGFVVAATATFTPGTGLGKPTIAVSVASYPANARFKQAPPNPPDNQLFGASVTWAGA